MENNFYIFGENEGIDTINLKLKSFNEDVVNSYLKKHGRKIEKGITLSKYKSFYNNCKLMIPECEIRIQAEALCMKRNIWTQLVIIVFKLYQKKIIDIPCLGTCPLNMDALLTIDTYLPYIVELTRLDFHFDFKQDRIALIDPIPFKDKKGNLSYTSYSEDGKKRRQSHWCCYDRRFRLCAVNQINHDIIMAMQFPMRIEYRFKKKNTQWLNLLNLKGNFDFVFNKYVQIMARSWKAKGCKCATVIPNGIENRYFSQLLELASKEKAISKNKSTKKSEKISFDENYYYVWQILSAAKKEPDFILQNTDSSINN